MTSSFGWWSKGRSHRGTPVVVKMENPNWSMVKLECPSEDDHFLLEGSQPGGGRGRSGRGKNAKQLTWVLLLKAHKAVGCLASMASTMLTLGAAVRRRVMAGKTDVDAATAPGENQTVKTEEQVLYFY